MTAVTTTLIEDTSIDCTSVATYLSGMEMMRARIRGNRAARDEDSYNSMESYVLNEGREMFRGDDSWTDDEREAIKQMSRGICFAQSYCFFNAQRAVKKATKRNAATQKVEIKYCEGYALSRFFPMLHAWVLVNGKVWDPTWMLIEADDKKDEPIASQYHGVEFTREQALKKLNGKNSDSISIIDDWQNGYPMLKKNKGIKNGVSV